MKKELFVLALVSALSLSAYAEDTIEMDNKSTSQAAQEQVAQEKEASGWVLVDSEIKYVSVKVNQALKSISEVGEISAVSAEIDESGKFEMPIDLNSINSAISIRDYRIKEWLFESDKFPIATVTSQIDMEVIKNLNSGDSITLNQPLDLEIRGQVLHLDSELLVSKSDDKLHVSTKEPAILDISKTDMHEGVKKLVEVMSLSSISEQIAISFSGEFVSR